MPGNPKNYGDKIKSHEKTTLHRVACSAFAQWKTGQQIDREHQKAMQNKATFWRKVLLWIVNITMIFATMNLAFRCHRESVSNVTAETFLPSLRCKLDLIRLCKNASTKDEIYACYDTKRTDSTNI